MTQTKKTPAADFATARRAAIRAIAARRCVAGSQGTALISARAALRAAGLA